MVSRFLFALLAILIATESIYAQPNPGNVNSAAKQTDVKAVVDILKEMRADDAQFRKTVLSDLGTIKADIVTIKGDITTIKGDIVLIKGDIVLIKADQATMKADIVLIKEDQRAMKTRLDLLEGEFQKAKAANKIVVVTQAPAAPVVVNTTPVFYFNSVENSYFCDYYGRRFDYYPTGVTYYSYPTYVAPSYSSYYAFSYYANYRGYVGVPHRAYWRPRFGYC